MCATKISVRFCSETVKLPLEKRCPTSTLWKSTISTEIVPLVTKYNIWSPTYE